MQKLQVLLIILLLAALTYMGWRDFRNEKRYEAALRNTFTAIDSIKPEIDSLKEKRKTIRRHAASVKQKEKERKNEAYSINSIDSLVRLANKLLAGKGN